MDSYLIIIMEEDGIGFVEHCVDIFQVLLYGGDTGTDRLSHHPFQCSEVSAQF